MGMIYEFICRNYVTDNEEVALTVSEHILNSAIASISQRVYQMFIKLISVYI